MLAKRCAGLNRSEHQKAQLVASFRADYCDFLSGDVSKSRRKLTSEDGTGNATIRGLYSVANVLWGYRGTKFFSNVGKRRNSKFRFSEPFLFAPHPPSSQFAVRRTTTELQVKWKARTAESPRVGHFSKELHHDRHHRKNGTCLKTTLKRVSLSFGTELQERNGRRGGNRTQKRPNIPPSPCPLSVPHKKRHLVNYPRRRVG